MGIIKYHLNEVAHYKPPDSDKSFESGSDVSSGSVAESIDSNLEKLKVLKSEKIT